ncbi:DUF742 domain-containing protein [Streptomyces avicenniae]|uniref:DUF742 domain-containing protein n=1 Tax=Streptomyces avicenniae TaxID=500153 RepID=UPI00069C44A4|nr:DUF742 domain-containing protein [Streptomyces avicenniae]
MSPAGRDDDDPARLYTLVGTRGRAARAAAASFDLVTLVVSEAEPVPGMQSEHARILRRCRRPAAVVELAAELGLPVTLVRMMLGELLVSGGVSVRRARASSAGQADPRLLEQVLVGLRNL